VLLLLLQPFQSVCDLIPLAETVSKLTSICQCCQEEASFSKRLSDDTAAIVIGGAEMYIPTCRSCYFDDAASMSLLSNSFASASASDASADELDVTVDCEDPCVLPS
jgi:hypothetical protein